MKTILEYTAFVLATMGLAGGLGFFVHMIMYMAGDISDKIIQRKRKVIELTDKELKTIRTLVGYDQNKKKNAFADVLKKRYQIEDIDLIDVSEGKLYYYKKKAL